MRNDPNLPPGCRIEDVNRAAGDDVPLPRLDQWAQIDEESYAQAIEDLFRHDGTEIVGLLMGEPAEVACAVKLVKKGMQRALDYEIRNDAQWTRPWPDGQMGRKDGAA